MNTSRAAAVVVLLLVIMIAVVYLNPGLLGDKSTSARGASSAFSTVGTEIKYETDSQAAFYSNNSRYIIFSTKDGVKYLSANGESKSIDTIFSFVSPILVGEGDIAAVSEPKGRAVYVFGTSGLLFEQRFDYPVLSFSVSKQGLLTVVLQTDDDYEINVYNKSGNIYRWVYTDYNMFPVSADVSNDGRVLAVSFLNVDVRLSSKIVFAFINADESRGYEDGIFASKEITGEWAATVKFMDNNNLIVVTEAQILCYKPNEQKLIENPWSIQLNNKLDKLAFSGSDGFVIALGEPLLNKEADDSGLIQFYNLSGAKTGEYNLDGKCSYLSASSYGAIAGADRIYTAINNRGDVMWEYAPISDVRQIIFLDNNGTFLVNAPSNATILKKSK